MRASSHLGNGPAFPSNSPSTEDVASHHSLLLEIWTSRASRDRLHYIVVVAPHCAYSYVRKRRKRIKEMRKEAMFNVKIRKGKPSGRRSVGGAGAMLKWKNVSAASVRRWCFTCPFSEYGRVRRRRLVHCCSSQTRRNRIRQPQEECAECTSSVVNAFVSTDIRD